MSKLTWTDIVKKYEMVAGPRYYGTTGIVVKRILNENGSTIAQIDKDGKEFTVHVEKIGKNKSKYKNFEKLEELDTFLSTLDLVASVPKASDAEILKFLSDTYMVRVKTIEDLAKRFTFVKWGDAIEMKDYSMGAVYALLVTGSDRTAEHEGLGYIGMTVSEFQEWLLSKGVKKASKPKRNLNYSLYD